MLGFTLKDPYGVEHGGEISGLGLLNADTVFAEEKRTTQVTGKLSDVGGIFSELSGEEYEGYEIHMGVTTNNKSIVNNNNVYGTYIHGIFDKEEIAKTIVKALLQKKGLSIESVEAFDMNKYKEEQYDILADEMRKNLDMDYIYKVMNGED